MRTLEDTPRTLAVALTLWSGAVAGASGAGILARLSGEELVALAIFAIAISLMTVLVDPGLRQSIAAWPAPVLASAAALLDASALWTAFSIARAGSDAAAALGSWPLALGAFFAAPLAAALQAVLILARRKAAIRTPRATSPAGSRAAT